MHWGMKTLPRDVWPWLVTLVVASVAPAALPEALKDFDAHVERTRAAFEVPGIAVAIVKDGAVALEKGYGVRRLGEASPVNAHTLFAIASNTKAFAAASLAILIDEGKLKWDDRVVDHLPWFAMSDPYVTREMTVRDLLVHRSGLALGAGDLLFWPATTYTTEEVARRLRHVPLATSFRGAYAYDNILYAVAGLTVQQIAGKPWDDFVRERIFLPVEMSETRVGAIEATADNNVAAGHALENFKDLKPVAAMSWSNNTPAGGIYSNVHDLAKWMLVQLGGGALPASGDGKPRRLFSEARQKEMWSIVTPIPIGEPAVPELAAAKPSFLGYAHGWVISDYRGKRIVSHTGGWPGMVSRTALVPELKLGVVVLTNQEAGAAFQSVAWRVIDAYLGAPPTDWIAGYVAANKKSQARADESWAKHVAARDPAAKLALPLKTLAGKYRDAWYGDVTIAEEGGKLAMRFSKTPLLVGDLDHWQHGTFIVRWRDRSLNADAWVTFSLTPDAKVDEVKMAAISPLTDFSFDFHHLVLKPVK